MSLSIAGHIAWSAIAAAQVQINVTSANIANADTEGYTVKSATQVSTVSAGVGTGTTITAIGSDVDPYLFAGLVDADSELGAAEVTASYTDRLQTLLGTVSDDDGSTSIAASLATLESTLSALASSSDDDTAKAEVIDALSDTTDQMRSLSSSIQSLRADADSEIADDVDAINGALATIDTLNDAIVAASAAGRSTADLEDQRNTALRTIAALIDVDTTTTSTGALHVYTTGGTALLDGSVHELDYSPAAATTADTVFDAITVGGSDITGEIGSGEIAGLLTLRDETLVDAQDELDTLASALIDTLDAITADGSAVPAPDTLTGTTEMASSDTLSATGSVRIALVDADGALAAYTDLDLSGYTTVGDLVAALDTIDGIDASLDADGRLVLASSNGATGVAVAALDGAIGDDGESFSAWFGLNAVLTGTGAADIRVSGDLLADSSLLPVGTLADDATLAVGDTVLSAGSSTVASALFDAMTGTTAWSASGGLGAQTGNFADYAASIVADLADLASDAESDLATTTAVQSALADSLSSQTGVNLDEETARLSDYQTLYSAAAQVMQVVEEMYATLLEVAKSAG
jgi:flagellar hook-associated protein 1 FlgK